MDYSGLLLVFVVIIMILAIWSMVSNLSRSCNKPHRVLITGGANGLGRAIAVQCLGMPNTKVAVWDIDERALSRLSKEFTGAIHTNNVDIANHAQILHAKQVLEQELGGPVNVLVNNAATLSTTGILTTKFEKLEEYFRINILSHYWMVQTFLPEMILDRHGHIITISSVLSKVKVPEFANYCVAKAAVCAFHECLELELYKDHSYIQLHNLCPATLSDTKMFSHVSPIALFSPLKSTSIATSVIEIIENTAPYYPRTRYYPILFYLHPIYNCLPVYLKLFLLNITGARDSIIH